MMDYGFDASLNLQKWMKLFLDEQIYYFIVGKAVIFIFGIFFSDAGE